MSDRILVVDDEEKWRNRFKSDLTRWGYEVDTADNADDALEKLERCHYDLALLDIRLDDDPSEYSFQRICDFKREKELELPILAATAQPDIDQEIMFNLHECVDDFMVKGKINLKKLKMNIEIIIRNKIFVSYFNEDKKWLDKIIEEFSKTSRKKLWNDTMINPSCQWAKDINDALKKTKVGVMLVTKGFLDSDYIKKYEYPKMIEAWKKGIMKIIWIPISHTDYESTDLNNIQAAHDPKKPLNTLDDDQLLAALNDICKKISGACQKTINGNA